ncbi:hypothetical protein DSO57_1034410 [Entomophthora muscae]|uniref:Uncharacterized protein n=1 Tax=Entomophthora muscae TaxID=34485 RepID=A0ACC2TAN9_9FUNG|nr:hypothetical protein DSO57_1034410 [Entomophthora muscae]
MELGKESFNAGLKENGIIMAQSVYGNASSGGKPFMLRINIVSKTFYDAELIMGKF